MNPPLSYRQAGVDTAAAERLVRRIGDIAGGATRPEVVAGPGGFAALCAMPAGYREPLLASATDGVGTKLLLAQGSGRHGGIGLDLVAMCVNDLLVCGAAPLFFLDYYASGRLHAETAAAVVEGIAEGCRLSGCALVGGETAEMPGLYKGDDYDLAGFCVGVVERSQVLDGGAVECGDLLVGLPSNGLHANGYSLVRAVLERVAGWRDMQLDGRPLVELLMLPTRIYVPLLAPLLCGHGVHALAHITGGGLAANLARVLPAGVRARIDRRWPRPPIFEFLAEHVSEDEMLRTFNCGLGMVAVVGRDSAEALCAALAAAGEQPLIIGGLEAGAPGARPQVDITI